MIGEEGKRYLSKILLHLCIIIHYIVAEKFYRYYLQAFSTEKISKCHVKDYLRIKSNQMIKMPRKVTKLDSKIVKGK